MKKLLLTVIIGLAVSVCIASTLYAQTNLLNNSDMEMQGDWIINQCDPNGTFQVIFGSSTVPEGGSGNSVEIFYDGSTTAEVFVYQPVEIIPGHTYKFSAAMLDYSPSLTDSWIEIAYVTTEPAPDSLIEEIPAAKFGTWQDCNGRGFDGLIETSCGADDFGNGYFQIPDTIDTDTIYFGINVGTWLTASIDLYFDNLTLSDSLDTGFGIDKPDIASRSFSIYPNPSLNGFVNIISSETSGLTYYSVFSILGEELLSGNFNGQTTLDLTHLKKGIYFISMTSNEILTTKKLLLE